MPVIPALRWYRQENQKDNGHPWLQSEFKATLEDKRHCLKTQARCGNWDVRKGRSHDKSSHNARVKFRMDLFI